MLALAELSPAEIDRYSRQLILQKFTLVKQQKIKACSIQIDYPLEMTALLLAASGFGEITFKKPSNADKALSARISTFAEYLRNFQPLCKVHLAENSKISSANYRVEVFENDSRIPLAKFELFKNKASKGYNCARTDEKHCEVLFSDEDFLTTTAALASFIVAAI